MKTKIQFWELSNIHNTVVQDLTLNVSVGVSRFSVPSCYDRIGDKLINIMNETPDKYFD